jgi:hypothetical protein
MAGLTSVPAPPPVLLSPCAHDWHPAAPNCTTPVPCAYPAAQPLTRALASWHLFTQALGTVRSNIPVCLRPGCETAPGLSGLCDQVHQASQGTQPCPVRVLRLQAQNRTGQVVRGTPALPSPSVWDSSSLDPALGLRSPLIWKHTNQTVHQVHPEAPHWPAPLVPKSHGPARSTYCK